MTTTVYIDYHNLDDDQIIEVQEQASEHKADFSSYYDALRWFIHIKVYDNTYQGGEP